MSPTNLEIQIQAMAIMVRVDGMKAENKIREMNESDPRHEEIDFIEMADQLDSLLPQVSHIQE